MGSQIKVDHILGRIRAKDSAVLDMPGGNEALKELIREIIGTSTINWSQIIGSPTSNTSLISYIDTLIERIEQNNYEADLAITESMINYFNALLNDLTITVEQITDLDTINQEFKDYIDTNLAEFETYINQLVLGETYTSELKQYIDNTINALETALTQLIATTINNDLHNYIDQLINQGGESTRLVRGSVTWIEDLDFQVSELEYYILNNRVLAAEKLVTIPENTAAHPMFSVIYADIFGNIGYIAGTAAASPAVPLVNDTTQIALTTVYIPANSNAPGVDPGGETSEIVNEVIYNENIEWVTAKTEETGIAINLADETDPQIGTKHISISVSGGTATIQTGEQTVTPQPSAGFFLPLGVPLDEIFEIPVTSLFPAHLTDFISSGVRHLVYYKYLSRNDARAYLINKNTGARYPITLYSPALVDFSVPELGFSVEVPETLSFYARSADIPMLTPVDLFVTGFNEFDQQFTGTAATSKTPTVAEVSFTPAAPVSVVGAKIMLSLQINAPVNENSGLLLEMYNGAAKVGSYYLNNGFNHELTGEYQRIIIPVEYFNSATPEISKLVIKPVGEWTNTALYLDNLILQTGLQEEIQTDRYVESITLEESNGSLALTLKRTQKLADLVALFGTIAAKTFWTGTAAAYAAIVTKDANTIYFVEVD